MIVLRLLFLLLLIHIPLDAQILNESSLSSLYDYLKKMHISGFLDDYDDIVLPLSKTRINILLNSLEKKKNLISPLDQKILNKYIDYYPDIHDTNFVGYSILGAPNVDLEDNICSNFPNHLYFFEDDNFYLTIDPVISLRSLADKIENQKFSVSQLISYGGAFYLEYKKILGFYLKGTNGAVFGARRTAMLDKRISQSYTFNETGLNFFDQTEGYLQLQNDFFTLQMGRERAIWGAGSINKLMLSENPPIFDFIKLNLAYKKFTYNYIHGWLVDNPIFINLDSLGNTGRTKAPKYFAISRIGYKPLKFLDFGITQAVVYSNRPFELAYLNPFLFWESAQRSMNDLDNSFLGFDTRILIRKGVLLNTSFLFDDLNFDDWFKGEWNTRNNGVAIQSGIHFSHPVLPSCIELKFEYIQIRPYMFSHQGYRTGLAYTNNGYLLGTDLQPNSIMLSTALDYHFSPDFKFRFIFEYKKHGKNIIDNNGNVIKNVGGDVFYSHTIDSEKNAYLLDGEIEKEYLVRSYFDYDYSFNVNLSLITVIKKYIYKDMNSTHFLIGFTINYNTRLFNF